MSRNSGFSNHPYYLGSCPPPHNYSWLICTIYWDQFTEIIKKGLSASFLKKWWASCRYYLYSKFTGQNLIEWPKQASISLWLGDYGHCKDSLRFVLLKIKLKQQINKNQWMNTKEQKILSDRSLSSWFRWINLEILTQCHLLIRVIFIFYIHVTKNAAFQIQMTLSPILKPKLWWGNG